jgi:hypothetical protein
MPGVIWSSPLCSGTGNNNSFNTPDQPGHDSAQQACRGWAWAKQRGFKHGGQLHCAALHKSLRLMLLHKLTGAGSMCTFYLEGTCAQTLE